MSFCARRRLVLAFACLLSTAVTAYPLTAHAAYPPGSSGYDVSWPQCGGPLPARGEVAVVGVNDGSPYTVNPCFAAEWQWAAPSPSASVYINLDRSAADLAAHHWSAYDDGYAAADWSAQVAGSRGATHPVMWWLDIETSGDWSCGAVCDTGADADVVRGAIDFLRFHGMRVGIYSNPRQWSIIAGGYAPGVPVWTTDYDDPWPWAHCGAGDAFAGGPVAVVQLFPGAYDPDYVCATPPGVVSTPAGPLAVGVEGADGGLWVGAGGGAFGFAPWGGHLSAAPALAWVPTTSGGASLLAVANGSDNSLWVRSSGYGWAPLSPSSACTDNPAIAVTGGPGASVLTVACRGLDGALWVGQTSVRPDARPLITGYVPYGGYLAAGPAVAEVDGQLTFAGTGAGGHVFTRTASRGWAPTALTCVDHPALAAGSAAAFLACQGTDGRMWYASNTGGGWTDGVPAGGEVIGGPGLGVTPGGEVYAFVEGEDHAVYFRTLGLDPTLGSFGWNGGQVVGRDGVGAA